MEIDERYINRDTATGQFTVDINRLKQEQVSVLKAIYKAGDKHMKYFHSTMGAFKFPDRRMKTFDTCYYERVLPEIAKILREYEQRQHQSRSAG